MNEGYQPTKESLSTRALHFLEDIWPSVYRTINDILVSTYNFIKDTISGLWR